MADAVRILHVDDEPEYSTLVAEMLEQRRDRFSVSATTSANAAINRVGARGIDCIVSDYQMPEMDGLAFLRAIRAEKSDLPFILLTGRGSEEVAARAISAGVTDYLQKSGSPETFTLLANRIENAVRNYRNARALDRVRTRWKLLVEESTDAIFILTRSGTVDWASSVSDRLLGVPPGEITGVDALEFVHPDDRDRAEAEYAKLIETDRDRIEASLRLRHADGTDVPVHVRGRDLLGHPVLDGVVVYVREHP